MLEGTLDITSISLEKFTIQIYQNVEINVLKFNALLKHHIQKESL